MEEKLSKKRFGFTRKLIKTGHRARSSWPSGTERTFTRLSLGQELACEQALPVGPAHGRGTCSSSPISNGHRASALQGEAGARGAGLHALKEQGGQLVDRMGAPASSRGTSRTFPVPQVFTWETSGAVLLLRGRCWGNSRAHVNEPRKTGKRRSNARRPGWLSQGPRPPGTVRQ